MQDRGAVIDKWVSAVQTQDWKVLTGLYRTDAVQEFPQTGERAVGVSNIMAIAMNYPGLPTTALRKTSGVGDKYVLDAMFTPRQIRGHGDVWIVEGTMDYGGNGVFEFATIFEFRDDKIAREAAYFAPRSDPPEWRSQWVERTR